jgi:beta-galactosidase/beta-glucuronidase
MRRFACWVGFLLFATAAHAGSDNRVTIGLNGTWDFDQTTTAFPPETFSRRIPVPGLIQLATPRIDQYDTFFPRPKQVDFNSQHNLLERDYEPRYNWYRRRIHVPANLVHKQAVLTILKSKYVTQVLVNGRDVGTSIACYTPVEFPVTDAIQFGKENEILIRVGDRAWLPSAAAGSIDKEKVHYLPGIWDDVLLTFTGNFRADRILMLPSLKDKRVTAKLKIRSFHPAQTLYGGRVEETCRVAVTIRENKSGRVVAGLPAQDVTVRRDNTTICETDVAIPNPHPWSPDDPFLYVADVSLLEGAQLSDKTSVRFGMRDFSRAGRHFQLNGKQIYLRGTNITLHRFFEDPDCGNLPWDRAWVRRLMTEVPDAVHWNAMRICVGIVPQFWYDIADETGLLLQNEWLYWQSHGWDDQIRREYTDWIWSDGNHPSIVIWDAINENWNTYVGNDLIPELKKLDPTRIWDAGYMRASDMASDEMDEPHLYRYGSQNNFAEYHAKHPCEFGILNDWPAHMRPVLSSSSAQLVNEYGWMWLWRDGSPSKLVENSYPYFLGENNTMESRREFQAYFVQLETEWLRTKRSLAGVLAFCYLANNYGYTGDWFIDDIRDLKPGPTLEWFAHCFAPAAVFIDLCDERYTKHLPPHDPGSTLTLNLVGVNDYDHHVEGRVNLAIVDADEITVSNMSLAIQIRPYGKQYLPVSMTLPEKLGGYLLRCEYIQHGEKQKSPIISRRYIKVGKLDTYPFPDIEAGPLRAKDDSPPER